MTISSTAWKYFSSPISTLQLIHLKVLGPSNTPGADGADPSEPVPHEPPTILHIATILLLPTGLLAQVHRLKVVAGNAHLDSIAVSIFVLIFC